jgi:hypothetical protein
MGHNWIQLVQPPAESTASIACADTSGVVEQFTPPSPVGAYHVSLRPVSPAGATHVVRRHCQLACVALWISSRPAPKEPSRNALHAGCGCCQRPP